VRLATWNVNSLKMRMPRVLELLEQHAPEVVCVQETKADPGAFPHLELQAAGYHAVDHSAGRWAGVAILARADLPLEDPGAGLAGESDATEARWIEATVDGTRIASVYVPNGRSVGSDSFTAKLQFLDAMVERAGALRGTPAIVAGDMNVCRTDLDVYDPAAFEGSTFETYSMSFDSRYDMRATSLMHSVVCESTCASCFLIMETALSRRLLSKQYDAASVNMLASLSALTTS